MCNRSWKHDGNCVSVKTIPVLNSFNYTTAIVDSEHIHIKRNFQAGNYYDESIFIGFLFYASIPGYDYVCTIFQFS